MARAKPRAASTPKNLGSTALRLRQPTEAVAALMRERERLLKAIAKKRIELERERESARVVAQTMFERMQPLVSERASLMEEVRKLFDGLFVEGRLSRSARKKVTKIYEWLIESGELEPLESEPHDPFGPDSPRDFDADDDWQPGAGAHSEANVSSAKHAGGQPGNETLRGLFRRLTVALHPDRVQRGHEQERRTDVMKEVTRAYEEGNLARLMELEQLWLSGIEVRGASPDDVAKCAELEKAIQELQSQQRALQSEMRELRASSPLSALFGSRRVGQSARQEQMEAFMAAAAEELEPLRQIRNYVRAFSERKLSLAEFLRGPVTMRVDERDMAEAVLEYVMGDLGFDFAPAKAPRTGRSRSRGRSKRSGNDVKDCPF